MSDAAVAPSAVSPKIVPRDVAVTDVEIGTSEDRAVHRRPSIAIVATEEIARTEKAETIRAGTVSNALSAVDMRASVVVIGDRRVTAANETIPIATMKEGKTEMTADTVGMMRIISEVMATGGAQIGHPMKAGMIVSKQTGAKA
jgi:hypothetical protein